MMCGIPEEAALHVAVAGAGVVEGAGADAADRGRLGAAHLQQGRRHHRGGQRRHLRVLRVLRYHGGLLSSVSGSLL